MKGNPVGVPLNVVQNCITLKSFVKSTNMRKKYDIKNCLKASYPVANILRADFMKVYPDIHCMVFYT